MKIDKNKLYVSFFGFMLLACLFPPWEYTHRTTYGAVSRPAGHSFILNPPEIINPIGLTGVSIDIPYLLLTFVLIVFAFASIYAALVVFGNKEDISSIHKPTALETHISKAANFIEQGKYDDAIALFRKILSMESNNPEAFFGLGVCYTLNGDSKLGIDYINKAAILGNAEARKYLKDIGR